MSIVIASSTDTQQQVNEAAGITPGTPAAPSEAPAEQESETADESETPGEDRPDQEEKEAESRRHSDYQRRINRLTREKYEAQARAKLYEEQLQERRREIEQRTQPQDAPRQQQPPGRPQEADFNRYEDYIEALTDWKAAHAYQLLQRDMQREQEQRRAYERQQSHQSAWAERLNQSRTVIPDFDSVLEGVEHIQLPPALQQAIIEHEQGPRLAYELAKDAESLERIARMSPAAALRELGRFEAKLDLSGATRKPPAISRAPEPISPVGQGSTRTTKSPDEMDYQEFKAWRRKNGAR